MCRFDLPVALIMICCFAFDVSLVKILQEIGFTANDSKHALQECDNNLNMSALWLCENCNPSTNQSKQSGSEHRPGGLLAGRLTVSSAEVRVVLFWTVCLWFSLFNRCIVSVSSCDQFISALPVQCSRVVLFYFYLCAYHTIRKTGGVVQCLLFALLINMSHGCE